MGDQKNSADWFINWLPSLNNIGLLTGWSICSCKSQSTPRVGMERVYGKDPSEIPSQFNKALCRTAPQSKSARVVLSQIDVENYCWWGQRVPPLHHSDTWHIIHTGDFNWALLIKGQRLCGALQCWDSLSSCILAQMHDRLLPESRDGNRNRWTTRNLVCRLC